MRLLQKMKKEINHEITAILLLSFAALSGISIYVVDSGLAFSSSQLVGILGLAISKVITSSVGQAKYVVPVLFVVYALMLLKNKPAVFSKKSLGLSIVFISLTTMLHLTVTSSKESFRHVFTEAIAGEGGGLIGAFFSYILISIVGIYGTFIVLGAAIIISFMLLTNTKFMEILSYVLFYLGRIYHSSKDFMNRFLFTTSEKPKKKSLKKKSRPLQKIPNTEELISINNQNNHVQRQSGTMDPMIKDSSESSDSTNTVSGPKPVKASISDEKIITSLYENRTSDQEEVEYQLPPLVLLQKNIRLKNPRMNKELSIKVKQLEDTLASFGVNGKVSQVSYGPAITRFEIHPETGTKVSKIVNLADDIALNLAASQVRIEAPIPGKAAVGIEVPNKEVSAVHFRDVIETPDFTSSPSVVTVGLGMDITGKTVIADLSKMPHLLIAGATGSGKSVCMNALICSLLYKALPTELKLMIIDPKMVELTNYNGIPHLIAPVITDSKKAATALRWMVNEMENRYELFATSGVKDIVRYNAFKSEENPELQKPALPYIVILIDELADLMMVAPAEVEDTICRLAQMARAAGIHLVVATQRPSVDVITGLIKANIPSRIAFAVSSQVDSRTILDMGGAEKLLGQGDMLYFPIGALKPLRVQGAFVSDKEVEKIVNFLKIQGVPKFENVFEEKSPAKKHLDDDDELLPEAVRLLLESNQASISLLQRRLRIGYTRAARLIDIMEEKGIVGGYEGSKPRNILIGWDTYNELFTKN